MKRIFLTTIILLICVAGYSQTSSDTTFKDITGEYEVALPNLSKFLSADVGLIGGFDVAVISLKSVGKKDIKWRNDTTELAHPSELEFEKEMLDCRDGYFLNHEGTRPDSEEATAMKGTTYCLKNYCRRTEFQGYNMGTSYYTDYISFEKLNCLIIFQISYVEHNCSHGYEGEGIKECERDQKRGRLVINSFISLVTEQLQFAEINRK